jgi:cation transporter-like permease
MALGLIPSRLSTMRQHLGEIRSAWAASVVMFGVYSATSSLIYGLGVFRGLFLRLMVTNLLVIPVIVLISYAVAIEIRRRGMDPDNFIIPIETSLSDGITTIALLLVISLGVG